MDNPGRLFGQIAAEAGCSEGRAKVALYLFGLAEQGRTVGYAASALKRQPATIKAIAREFMVDLADYRPYARTRDKGVDVEPRYTLGAACGR